MADTTLDHTARRPLVERPSIDRLILQHEIEAFYFHEADLLMSRRYDEWLALLADDIHYYMPLRKNVSPREPDKNVEPLNLALIDDDKYFLDQRVKKIATGVAWTEEPAARITYLVSNIVIDEQAPEDSDYSVSSVFILHRNRLEHDEDSFSGRRWDRLNRTASGLQILRRQIELDQSVLLSKNLSVLF